jgi:hypothetical protein
LDYRWSINNDFRLEAYFSPSEGALVFFSSERENDVSESVCLFWPLEDVNDLPRVESYRDNLSVEESVKKLAAHYKKELLKIELRYHNDVVNAVSWAVQNVSQSRIWNFVLKQLTPTDLDEGEKNSSVYPAKVKISPDRFSLFELKRKSESELKTVIMDPEFQRNYVWNAKQKSELIESILMGIPLPVLYFFQQKDGKFQVVDGRQRLTTVFQFMNNKFPLSGLEILKNENGKIFSKLDPLMQSTIEDYQVNVYTIQPPTPEKIKFDIFDRVNRSGTSLTHQEMRNALYQGKSTRMLKELAESNEFQTAIGRSIEHKRMKDRYIILRFLSFYMHFNKINGFEKIEYKSDIDDFLAKAMERINAFTENTIDELKTVFLRSMKLSYQIMGEDVFRFTKESNGHRLPINMALFEVLAFFFSDKRLLNSNKLDVIKDTINRQKKEFFDSDFSKQVDSSTKVNARFETIIKLQKELLE